MDTPSLKNVCRFYFSNNSVKHRAILAWKVRKNEVNHCSFAHLTLLMLLHYPVKCHSRSSAVNAYLV